jgi:flagellar hook-associated protein 3 FlgL
MGRLQEQMTSGKQINRPSDSPTGTVSAMQLRQEIRRVEQYGRNIDDGMGWLSTIDTALTSTLSQLNRASDLTLQGMSTGSTSAESREAMAVEVENIRDSLISVANTQYLDRPVLGGTTMGKSAYDANGVFLDPANANPVMRTVGDGAQVRVDITGPEVFGSSPNDLFTVLTNIADNLRNNPSALGTNLTDLNTTKTNIQSQLAGVGARYNRLSVMKDTGEQRLLTLGTQRSDVEDIDLPKTIMDLQLQQTAYQAALSATAKVIQPSLVDFLR